VIEGLVPEPKFKIGELVELTRTAMMDAARGQYEIVRLLPAVDGVPLYRIKNRGENHERVAKETDLKRYG
jgi:hypothetical protein